MKNRLVIAAAGSGKTTFLVKEALKHTSERVLITTYTESNEAEIRKKIVKLNKFIPDNITVQTWFSFLLQHGARPYQGGLFKDEITGLILVNEQSTQGIAEADVARHYFTKNRRIFSDKLSKFVIRCNDVSGGAVIDRLSRIFAHVYVDEAQDLAGYDLDFVKLLLASKCNVLMVADPRQVVYLTHNEKKYQKYANGKLKEFISAECKKLSCQVDEDSLNISYRNNADICQLSSRLYPAYKSCQSSQKETTVHDGIYVLATQDAEKYLKKFRPVQLRLSKISKGVNEKFDALNFGESKGLTFERVLIYPTKEMAKWLYNESQELKDKTRAQFYVAITRAKYSVAIISDVKHKGQLKGVKVFESSVN